ncbi:MAG: cyclic peptide export ABC transporter [Archangiaceae bacterium]|nr:cyclic peptide export ABC transporter [Archangiaceae bacterium]
MSLLVLLLRTSWPKLLLGVVGGLVAGACTPAMIVVVTSTLARGELSAADAQRFGVLAVATLLSRAGASFALLSVHQQAVYGLRTAWAARLLATPYRKLEELGSWRILHILIDDIHVVSTALVHVPAMLINAAILLACFGYLAWLSVPMAVATFALFVAAVLVYRAPISQALTFFREARAAQQSLYKAFRSMTAGLKELMMHRARLDAFLAQDLGPAAATLRKKNLLTLGVYHLAFSAGRTFFFVIIALMLFALPTLGAMEPRVLTAFALTVLYMQLPSEAIMASLADVNLGNAAVRTLEEHELLPAGGAPPPAASGLGGEWAALELRGITTEYHREKENSTFTLGPIDLTLRRGELVYLVGGNGSGKTTLAKLLVGLYAPSAGTIRLGGDDVVDGNRDAYRQLFSAVFADCFVFESLLGLSSPEQQVEAERHLTELQLNHKVRVSEGRLSTTDLSTGQKKRLALLTAYLEDRPFYVFDEWAADQDPTFKRVFYDQILPALKQRGKTVLVITHDDRFFDRADRVIKLESGQLVSG